jgi:hypothetical protein
MRKNHSKKPIPIVSVVELHRKCPTIPLALSNHHSSILTLPSLLGPCTMQLYTLQIKSRGSKYQQTTVFIVGLGRAYFCAPSAQSAEPFGVYEKGRHQTVLPFLDAVDLLPRNKSTSFCSVLFGPANYLFHQWLAERKCGRSIADILTG